MPAAQDLSPLRKLEQQLRADPKKAAVLGGLSLVLLVVVIRAFSGGPSRASASPTPVVRTPEPTSFELQSPASPPVASGNAASSRTQRWLAGPAPGVTRNLFQQPAGLYRNMPNRTRPATSGGARRIWDGFEKSFAKAADERRQQELRHEALRRDASTMRLQSTLRGKRPAAMIDGRLVREGDAVGNGFRVIKIESRRVLITRDGETIELNMGS